MKITIDQLKPNLRKLDDEEWRFVPDIDNKYQVSNYGRIKSFCYDCNDGKIVKPGNIKGYRSIGLKVDGQKKTMLIHKLVAASFIPQTDTLRTVVIHNDWNKLNNHVSNLQWLTRGESFSRAQSKLIEARKKKGKIVTHSKLTIADVSIIKQMLESGRKQKVIAQLFCISEMQISRIKNKISWSEV